MCMHLHILHDISLMKLLYSLNTYLHICETYDEGTVIFCANVVLHAMFMAELYTKSNVHISLHGKDTPIASVSSKIVILIALYRKYLDSSKPFQLFNEHTKQNANNKEGNVCERCLKQCLAKGLQFDLNLILFGMPFDCWIVCWCEQGAWGQRVSSLLLLQNGLRRYGCC